MGKVADIARIREILAENLLLRHKLRLLAYKDPKHRDTLLPEAPHPVSYTHLTLPTTERV